MGSDTLPPLFIRTCSSSFKWDGHLNVKLVKLCTKRLAFYAELKNVNLVLTLENSEDKKICRKSHFLPFFYKPKNLFFLNLLIMYTEKIQYSMYSFVHIISETLGQLRQKFSSLSHNCYAVETKLLISIIYLLLRSVDFK